MRDSIESLTEVKINNIHCSPLTHQESCHIIEGYQVGQVSHPVHISMLTAPITSLFFICLEMVSRIACSITFQG